jgi:formylglycine-generating enzyme required for sulfatase activity
VSDLITTRIEALGVLSLEERLHAVGALAEDAWAAIQEGVVSEAAVGRLRQTLVELVQADVGTGVERLPVGVLLGRIGDPRLRIPSDDDYWVELSGADVDAYRIGKYPVTNHEYRLFVDGGGYENQAHWTEEGWAWLQGTLDPWPVVADSVDTDRFLVANQPVIGVTLHEAEAYASWAGARLMRWAERVFAVRGEARRPYPWGSPFGEGNTNSKEEVLHRPCAVGLYVRDRTPEGVSDLAGNAGEWTLERDFSGEALLHPGSWDQPSLASWAKALTTEQPSARWPALGFRLARDTH